MNQTGTSSQRLQVVFAGGGTGGHIYPALAIAEQLQDKSQDVDVSFICSTRALDARILTEEAVEYWALAARPFSLRPLALAEFVRTWGRVVAHCRKHLRNVARRGPTIVVGMGGFVSAPAAAAARKERLHSLLVNLDATPGRANRWVAKRSARVFTAAEVEGQPNWTRVRPIVRWGAVADGDSAFCRREMGLDPAGPTLLVTGASQGARSINHLMMALLERHTQLLRGWQVIHQCGPVATAKDDLNEQAIVDGYARAGVRAIVKPLFREMGRVWGSADLAISRCGAGSVAEAWANRVPSVFLPYPYHKDQHQRKNALPLERIGGAIIATDHVEVGKNMEGPGAELVRLLSDPGAVSAMRLKLRELGPADGASAVADEILAAGVHLAGGMGRARYT